MRPLLALLLLAGCAPARGGAVAEIEIAAAPPATAEPTAAPDQPQSAPVLGRWAGMGEQTSGSRWSIHVELHSLGPGPCGRVRYHDGGCVGEWICKGKSDGKRLEARERITRGPCILTGDMTMSVEKDGTLDWHWENGDEKAWGRLSRSAR